MMNKELKALEKLTPIKLWNNFVLLVDPPAKARLLDCDWMNGLEEYDYIKTKIEYIFKALEIIKRREINIHALLIGLKRFDTPYWYNILVGDKYQMTQEEYDILKGVLVNV